MKNKLTHDKVQLIINWCQQEFGTSKYQNDIPKIRVYKTRGTSIQKQGMCGSYFFDTNTICVFLGSNKNILEVCKTVIHEYIHYILNDDEYNEYAKSLKIEECGDIELMHPHEKLCRDTENICGKRCFNELKNNLFRI